MSFKLKKYQIVRNAVSNELCYYLSNAFELSRNYTYINKNIDPNSVNEKFKFNDDQVPISFSLYSPMFLETLSFCLNPIVNEISGIDLLPSYTYGRIYYNGSSMPPHTDRPSCEYSVTVNLFNDPDPWEIYFKTVEDEVVPILLYPGDMIVYKGEELLHWRNVYQGDKVIQAFCHYVDSNGPHKRFLFDTRPYYGFDNSHCKENRYG